METFLLKTGSETVARNGSHQGYLREVEFKGELLGEVSWYDDPASDTRGTLQALYRTEHGRLIVSIENWSRWQGEPTDYSVVEVIESDLEPNGRFERLGAECGFGRPMTLDELFEERGANDD